jgi:AcrR family transcriptional regulator
MAKAQFDRDDVLDKATNLFWQHGFSATSMQQIVKATGLKPGSIYLAFGNKEGLFKEALERYAEKGHAHIRETLDHAPGIGEGICSILERYIEQSAQKEYCSCFVVKTMLELAAGGHPLYQLASEKLSATEALYRSYLEQAYDPQFSQERAASLMIHIFGIRVYGYLPDSATRIRQGLRAGLPWLPWDETN